MNSESPPVGPSSLTRDLTQAACMGSVESLVTGPPGKFQEDLSLGSFLWLLIFKPKLVMKEKPS